jgi:hypothetical protein
MSSRLLLRSARTGSSCNPARCYANSEYAKPHARQIPYDRDPYLRSGKTEGRGGSQDPGVRRGALRSEVRHSRHQAREGRYAKGGINIRCVPQWATLDRAHRTFRGPTWRQVTGLFPSVRRSSDLRRDGFAATAIDLADVQGFILRGYRMPMLRTFPKHESPSASGFSSPLRPSLRRRSPRSSFAGTVRVSFSFANADLLIDQPSSSAQSSLLFSPHFGCRLSTNRRSLRKSFTSLFS